MKMSKGYAQFFPRQSLPSLTHSSSNKQESVNKKATDIWKASIMKACMVWTSSKNYYPPWTTFALSLKR
jgi:hypothetical protein